MAALFNTTSTKRITSGCLAQSWETPDPKTWIFHLRTDIRWQNGDPLRADDVLHSFNRVMTDPNSKQKQNLSMVAKMEAIDDHTVKVTTKEPTAPLLSYLTQFIITNKSVFDKYGAKAADEQHPVGAAEYKLERLIPGQMFAIVKNPDFPGMTGQERRRGPDRLSDRARARSAGSGPVQRRISDCPAPDAGFDTAGREKSEHRGRFGSRG